MPFPRVRQTLYSAGVGMSLLLPTADMKRCYPTKLFEYMAAGLPVVSDNLPHCRAIVEDAGYSAADIMRIGVWLDDPRDFWSFNKVFAEYFGEHPPARACVQSSMVVDCKLELDCVAYRKTT